MTEPLQPEIMEPEFENNSKVKLDLAIGINDITDMMVSEHEENLILEKDTVEGNLAGARKEHAEAEKVLTDMAEALIESHNIDRNTQALASALKKFNGRDYHCAIAEGSVDIEKKTCSAEIRVVDSKKYEEDSKRSYYSDTGVIIHKSVTIKFTAEMKTQIKEIGKKAEEVAKVQELLTDVRKRLADLPRLVRRAKGAIVKAQLKGELDSPNKILEAVVGIQPRALPAPNGN